MNLLHNESLVIHQDTGPGLPDADGVATRVIDSKPLAGCNVQQVGTNESLGSEHVVTNRLRVSTDFPAEWVQEGDTATWRGTEYAIEGKPQTFYSGVLDHTEFIIRTSKG